MRSALAQRAFARSIACSDAPVRRFGSEYGGWWVPVAALRSSSIVYSVGLGEDATFDIGLIEEFGCKVWAFDPTPRAIEYAASIADPRFGFRPWAVWSSDTRTRFYLPRDPGHVSHSIVNAQQTSEYLEVECRRLTTIMGELSHDRIDLLKLDIEGAEYEVLAALPVHPMVLCVEFHPIDGVDPATFIRLLPYTPVKVDGWNVTMLRRETPDVQ